MRPRLTVAVLVCAYTEQRWDDILAAHRSLTAQTSPPDEIVVVVDHNAALLTKLRHALPLARIVPNTGPRGLSGARNTGIADTVSDLVLFLDDDAWADDDWVSHMVGPFEDCDVMGVAGWAQPNWVDSGRPRWFPEPFLWVVGCSYQGLPGQRADIRNPLGCAMAFRRSAIERVGGFSGSVGRVGTHPVGCEETELAIRIRQATPSARVVLEPLARVHHQVTAPRLRLRYFLDRCYWEGVSKAVVAEAVGAGDALESERSYATRVLPIAFVRGLLDVFRGRPSGLLRSAAIVAGLTVTTVGYLRGGLGGSTCAEVDVRPIRADAA